MPITEQELRAIAYLALRVRKSTSGAGDWNEMGLMSNLRKIQNRNLHMTIEHVLRHAADAKAKNPGVLLGSFTPDAPTSAGPPHPPKREETCRVPGHEGYRRDHCGGCHADALAGDPAPTATRPADPTTKDAALAECRAAVATTAASVAGNQEADMTKAQEAAYAPIYAAQQLHEHEQRVADEEAGQ